MPKQPKPKQVGRPKLAKGDAKATMLRVRISPAESKAVEAAAKTNKQTVSEWIRSVVSAALLPVLAEANRVNGARSNKAREIRRNLRAVGHKGGLRGETVVE